jgi:membrane protein
MTFRLLLTIIREAIAESLTDRLPRMGAALAFYMTFSLAPTLLVVVAIAGAIFGRKAAEGRILDELKTVVGSDAAATLQALISAAGQPGSGLLASLIAGITVLVGAIGYFCELQSQECIDLLAKYIAQYPSIWNEDIGED